MFVHQYLVMCREAREFLEYIRIFNESSISTKELKPFRFKIGDYFHHPSMGEDGIGIVVRVERSSLREKDDPRPFKTDECIWIPSSDQLIEEVRRMPFAILDKKDLVYYFEGYVLGSLSDEERTLAYYMEKHERLIWDFGNQKWIKISS